MEEVKKAKELAKKEIEEKEEAENAMLESENEKEGTQATKEYFEKDEEIKGLFKEIVAESLGKKRNYSKEGYKTKLGEIFMNCLAELDWPIGFDWRVFIRERGVAVAFTDQHKILYSKGFKETGDVKKDLNAINLLVLQTENTIDRIIEDEKRATSGRGSGRGTDFKRTGSKRIPQRPV